MTPSWCCRNSAAKLAASWARFTKLAASMVHIYQTCCKYGSPSHTWRISGSTRQYDHARKVFSLYCWIVEIAHQRLFANPQAAVLLSWWFSRDVGNWYQTGCLRVIWFTTKRSNQRKTTTKHAFCFQKPPINRKFKAIARRISFTGGFGWVVS